MMWLYNYSLRLISVSTHYTHNTQAVSQVTTVLSRGGCVILCLNMWKSSKLCMEKIEVSSRKHVICIQVNWMRKSRLFLQRNIFLASSLPRMHFLEGCLHHHTDQNIYLKQGSGWKLQYNNVGKADQIHRDCFATTFRRFGRIGKFSLHQVDHEIKSQVHFSS